ncbi:8-oxo-dGTP diphosphatase [Candidatus Uhrbacteria bacterium]|nr:8-oxo-dGTP diphosphatase [Candidatus Uhrbacteria bacterium]
MYSSITNIPYTICFCKAGEKILMLHRNRPPNQFLWNGVGGKIQEGETIEESLRREVLEETGLDVSHALDVRFVGVVSWMGARDPSNENRGMYAYVADFPAMVATNGIQETDEGKLEWKPIPWMLDHSNTAIAENIPYFLPRMLTTCSPAEYRCVYDDGVLTEFLIRPWKSSTIQT